MLDCLLHNLTEQYAEEQHDTEAFTDETSGLDTDILESSEEATLSMTSVAPSLADVTNEVIFEEPFTKDETFDIIIDEEKDVQLKVYSQKSTVTAVHGQYKWEVFTYLIFSSRTRLHMSCITLQNNTPKRNKKYVLLLKNYLN